jgi:hypothetical protein
VAKVRGGEVIVDAVAELHAQLAAMTAERDDLRRAMIIGGEEIVDVAELHAQLAAMTAARDAALAANARLGDEVVWLQGRCQNESDWMDRANAAEAQLAAMMAERDYFKEVSERYYASLRELDAPAEVKELAAELCVMKRHSLSLANALDTMKAQLDAVVAERDAHVKDRVAAVLRHGKELEALTAQLAAMTAARDVIHAEMLMRDECARSRKAQLAVSEAARGRLDALVGEMAEVIEDLKMNGKATS